MAFEKHIFICINQRPPESPKGCCGNEGMAIRVAFAQELAKRGLKNKVRANKSGCLDVCSFGPSVVIYPAGIWYKKVTPEDVPEIVETSIIGDDIVARLQLSNDEFLTRK
ncbi:MAG: (2Fe-2S) ferredoxin domain-containing protein [Candidatus Marinimicrobia bacterium]|nr:(2Fe-2S) ferredoxin domain-containing protein [Candidatus Neomarinimicrobiota bacterium]